MHALWRCPFCDSPPRLVPADLTAATWVVVCLACDIEGPWHDSQRAAVDAWNTRPQLQAEIAAAKRFAIIVAQTDASLPPHLEDDETYQAPVTVGEVRDARTWLMEHPDV